MKRQLRIFSFISFFILNYLLPFQALCQYNKSLSEKDLSAGFLGLSTLETDFILKFAKESAPFDKPFFIKIKRLSQGSANPALGTKTEITKYQGAGALPAPIFTPTPALPGTLVPTSSVEIKKETPIPNSPASTDPARVYAIFIEDEKDRYKRLDEHINKYAPINIVGDIYEEKPDSEYIYVRIGPLRPERAFRLTIVWWLHGGLATTEEYRFTTATQTLEKRLKQKIIPQIGVTTVLFKHTDKDNNVTRRHAKLSLMFGFHYYPRAIDPDISFRAYKPWALQRFSVLGGVTINSLAIEDARGDLLGSSNVVLGIGYQAFDAFKISYGVLLFNELNPNKLYAGQKKIVGTSAITFTLDLKLKDILGGIVTTLGFK